MAQERAAQDRGVYFCFGNSSARTDRRRATAGAKGRAAGCYPCLGLSQAAGATHPGLQVALVQLQAPPHPGQLILLLTSWRLLSIHVNGPPTPILQLRSPKEKSTPGKSPKAGNWAGLASTRFRGQLWYERSPPLGTVHRGSRGEWGLSTLVSATCRWAPRPRC